MNRYTFLFFLVFLFAINQSHAQYHSTRNDNQFNDYTYFDLFAKTHLGLALPVINQQTNYGINPGIGIVADYYFHPIFAFRSGIEFDYVLAGKSITETEFSTGTATPSLQDAKYTYIYYSANMRIPLGIVCNLTHLNQGIVVSSGIYTNIGLTGKININKNDKIYASYPAFEYNAAQNDYTNKFKRITFQWYLNTAYNVNKRMLLGAEFNLGVTDFLNNQNINGYAHNIAVYLLYRLKSSKGNP